MHNTKKSSIFALFLEKGVYYVKLTEKEQDLIEAIRNYRNSKGRLDSQDQEWYIVQLFNELMGL